MMTRWTAVAALALLAGCAGGQGMGRSSPDYGLSARLHEGFNGRVEVGLSEPAHVALFEVVPGRGVGLHYPFHGSERGYFRSGWTPVYASTFRTRDWYADHYAVDFRGYQQPRYFLLIASRHPLRLARLQGNTGGLRRLLGYNTVSSFDTRRVMDEVVDAVLPYQPDGDWDTDILVVWPEQPLPRMAGDRMVAVRCGDGLVRVVPVELARFACQSQPDRAGPPPPPARDTVDVQVPTRRRPGVPTAGEADAQRPVRPEVTRPGDRPEPGQRGRPVDTATDGARTGDAPVGRAPARPQDPAQPARVERPGDGGRTTPVRETERPRERPEPAREAPSTREAPPARETPAPAPVPPPRTSPAPAEPRAVAPVREQARARPEAPAPSPIARAQPASEGPVAVAAEAPRTAPAPSEPRAVEPVREVARAPRTSPAPAEPRAVEPVREAAPAPRMSPTPVEPRAVEPVREAAPVARDVAPAPREAPETP